MCNCICIILLGEYSYSGIFIWYFSPMLSLNQTNFGYACSKPILRTINVSWILNTAIFMIPNVMEMNSSTMS